MAIDSISAVNAAMSLSPLSALGRPSVTTPSAGEGAAQANNAQRTAESTRGVSPASASAVSQQYLSGPQNTSVPALASNRVSAASASNAPEESIRAAASQIARASSAPESNAASTRAASEAYQAEASARNTITQQQQNNGATSVNVMA